MATGLSPARLHRGPWETSPGAMEATGDRRAGTQSRRGSPARQSGPATQTTRVRWSYRKQAGAIPLVVRDTPHGWAAPRVPPKGGDMWPYPWTHVGTPFHLGHMDRVAATMPSEAHAKAAQEAPDIGQWEGQDVPLVRPPSCLVKGGIPSSRRHLSTYLPRSRVTIDKTIRELLVDAGEERRHSEIRMGTNMEHIVTFCEGSCTKQCHLRGRTG